MIERYSIEKDVWMKKIYIKRSAEMINNSNLVSGGEYVLGSAKEPDVEHTQTNIEFLPDGLLKIDTKIKEWRDNLALAVDFVEKAAASGALRENLQTIFATAKTLDRYRMESFYVGGDCSFEQDLPTTLEYIKFIDRLQTLFKGVASPHEIKWLQTKINRLMDNELTIDETAALKNAVGLSEAEKALSEQELKDVCRRKLAKIYSVTTNKNEDVENRKFKGYRLSPAYKFAKTEAQEVAIGFETFVLSHSELLKTDAELLKETKDFVSAAANNLSGGIANFASTEECKKLQIVLTRLEAIK